MQYRSEKMLKLPKVFNLTLNVKNPCSIHACREILCKTWESQWKNFSKIECCLKRLYRKSMQNVIPTSEILLSPKYFRTSSPQQIFNFYSWLFQQKARCSNKFSTLCVESLLLWNLSKFLSTKIGGWLIKSPFFT